MAKARRGQQAQLLGYLAQEGLLDMSLTARDERTHLGQVYEQPLPLAQYRKRKRRNNIGCHARLLASGQCEVQELTKSSRPLCSTIVFGTNFGGIDVRFEHSLPSGRGRE